MQLFLVRFDRDLCTISADSSGALLHRRGYRLATAKAPLRETLAAALLLAMEYDGSVPLVDPMCGAGTIAIEAALIARRIAPGLARSFSCERWPDAPHPVVRGAALGRAGANPRVRAVGDRRERPGRRRCGGRAGERRARGRCGGPGDPAWRALRHRAAEGPGLLLTNPPYGARLGASAEIRNLYAQFGNVARAKCDGWTLAFLSADRAMESQVKLQLREALRFRNGGIPVRLMCAEVPARA